MNLYYNVITTSYLLLIGVIIMCKCDCEWMERFEIFCCKYGSKSSNN